MLKAIVTPVIIPIGSGHGHTPIAGWGLAALGVPAILFGAMFLAVALMMSEDHYLPSKIMAVVSATFALIMAIGGLVLIVFGLINFTHLY